MLFSEKEIAIKGGKALLRSPRTEDAQEMLQYLRQTSAETEFLIRSPEDAFPTLEQEERFLRVVLPDENHLMIVCEVDGHIAGNCSLMLKDKAKMRHRASIGIALLKMYWGRGIGTHLLMEMEKAAREKGVMLLELEVLEGNERAIRLYEKMGFHFVGERPDAFLMPDGRLLKEYFMQKKL